MHVISASRRTDIPAFHSEWFMNRIRSRLVTVASPFGRRLYKVSLEPKEVIAIVFWTKNAAPILQCLEELTGRGHCFTFLYTINNYPAFLEPGVPELSQTLKVVDIMTKRFGSSIIRWRYDTIVFCKGLDRRWHARNFQELCRHLASHTSECIFSFCDYYKKTVKNMDRVVKNYYIPDQAECKEIAEELAEIASETGISLASCGHDFLVTGSIRKARCIDTEFLAKVVDSVDRLDAIEKLKPAPTRKECACFESRDIGAYDTCVHGCAYCYANTNLELARKNFLLISSDSDCLDPHRSGLEAS